jgi:cytoskeletal protein CcmA (bactofilin family)
MRIQIRQLMRASLMAFVIMLVLAIPASAQGSATDRTSRDQIVLSGQLIVPQDETVDTALIFHGPASIEGTVTGSVIVFDGTTDVSGHVEGDVVVFNGAVTVRSGAQIGGDLVTTDTPTVEPGATITGQRQRVATRFDAGDIGFASRFVWWVGYSISTLVLGLLLLLIAPALDGAIDRTSRQRTGASIGLGLAVFFLLPLVAVLFLVVVVAIPLGVFLLLALALLYTVGYVAGAHAIGRRLAKPPTSRFLAFLLGWGIVRVLGLVPFLGGLVWTVVSIVGLGVLWVASRRAREEEMIPPAPPPAPVTMGM